MYTLGLPESERADLNRGPHGPEPCALAKLRYAPNNVLNNTIGGVFDKLQTTSSNLSSARTKCKASSGEAGTSPKR